MTFVTFGIVTLFFYEQFENIKLTEKNKDTKSTRIVII